MAEVLLVDHYDSFTHNVAHALREAGARCDVVPHDAGLGRWIARGYAGIVIGPGPCTPAEARASLDLFRSGAEDTPILGICLGHQALAVACGGEVVRARQAVHGRVVRVEHDRSGCLAEVPSPVEVVRYNSLVVSERNLPEVLAVTARSDDGAIMGLRHRRRPLESVQFHPESWLDGGARVLFATWLRNVTSCAPSVGRAGCAAR